jgi:hypothetical protein
MDCKPINKRNTMGHYNTSIKTRDSIIATLPREVAKNLLGDLAMLPDTEEGKRDAQNLLRGAGIIAGKRGRTADPIARVVAEVLSQVIGDNLRKVGEKVTPDSVKSELRTYWGNPNNHASRETIAKSSSRLLAKVAEHFAKVEREESAKVAEVKKENPAKK